MRAIDMSPPMLATIDESAPLIDAAKMMREKGVGDILITRRSGRETRPIGLVTDRDITVHAIACDLNPAELSVADLCTRDPVTVDAEALDDQPVDIGADLIFFFYLTIIK